LLSAIQTAKFDQAPGGVIFREIRELLWLHFVFVKFSFIPRSCNGGAHELAQAGFVWDLGQPFVWFDPLPSFVKTLLDRDLVGPETPK